MTRQVLQKHSQSSKQYFVPLEHLPEHFPIPADLQARFGYDSKRQGLTFEGWMCKATYDRLRDISNDYHYQRALERLFQIAIPVEDTPPHHGFGLLITTGLALATVLAALVGVLLHRH